MTLLPFPQAFIDFFDLLFQILGACRVILHHLAVRARWLECLRREGVLILMSAQITTDIVQVWLPAPLHTLVTELTIAVDTLLLSLNVSIGVLCGAREVVDFVSRSHSAASVNLEGIR